MKSAWELALEKTGGGLRIYTDEQKEKLAEVNRIYDAKAAEAKLAANRRRTEAGGDPAQLEQIADDLRVELASVEQRRERDKNAVRED